MLKPLISLLLVTHCVFATADEWGSIRGRFIVEGEIPARKVLITKDAAVKDKEICSGEEHLAEDLLIDKETRGLANVFVYLAKAPKRIHPDLIEPPKEAVSVTHKGCQFVPHCQICRTRQPIRVTNDDSIAHNTHPYPLRNPVSGGLVRPLLNEPENWQYQRPEMPPMKLSCDFHPWMSGYWLIADHPYAALTDKDGKFRIDNLPVGDHEFRVWHERVGYLNKEYKISVAAGDPVELPVVTVDIESLKKH